jgi:hypothetical protein
MIPMFRVRSRGYSRFAICHHFFVRISWGSTAVTGTSPVTQGTYRERRRGQPWFRDLGEGALGAPDYQR